MSEHMSKLLEEAQKRETQFESVQTELQLQLKLLEAQVKKAQLEKAEIKCEMTQERMEIAQELNLERDRSINLERTVSLLKEQLEVYEVSKIILSRTIFNQSMYSISSSCRSSRMSYLRVWVIMPNSFNILKHKLRS